MNAPTRVAVFGAGLAVAFAGAFGVGRAADLGMPGGEPGGAHPAGATPGQNTPGQNAHGHGDPGPAETMPTTGMSPKDGAGHADHGSPAAADAVPGGLQVAQDGYRLVLDHPSAEAGNDRALRFRVIGPDNQPLTRYGRTHDKDLHLIAVRRDLTGFQHLHPQLGGDGTWSTQVDLTPGSWRVFADFDPAGDVAPMTLGADLQVPGSFDPRPVPGPSATATVDGYTVSLEGELRPGTDSKLTVSVSRDGRPVTDLQPYLAAYGHLVALRAGDLAYLHVHPDGAPGDGHTDAGPHVVFHTTAPSAGTYRLYLDFKHGDVVRTAEFTITAGPEAPAHGH